MAVSFHPGEALASSRRGSDRSRGKHPVDISLSVQESRLGGPMLPGGGGGSGPGSATRRSGLAP